MNEKLFTLKTLCKDYAAEIKKLTIEIKNTQRASGSGSAARSQCIRHKLSKTYRIHHIAYCLLRGKKYEQIENPKYDCKKLNKRDWDKIEEIRRKYEVETICISA